LILCYNRQVIQTLAIVHSIKSWLNRRLVSVVDRSKMLGLKKTAILASLLTFAIIIPTLSILPSYAQFIPCKIVNLNPIPPDLVQAGQSFQVTTNLTVSCDPSVLPIIRVDLQDATNSKTLSTNSVPYYTSSSSFTLSVVNQATARTIPGSWALQVQAYAISGLNGQSVGSASKLFQVNVKPYTPPVTQMQTTESTTRITSSLSTISIQPTTTVFENLTEASSSYQEAFNTETSGGFTGQLIVPAAILLIGIAAFGLLMFAGSRRGRQRAGSMTHCSQCGASLNYNEKYCTSCGSKQRK
jgi:hypothetical protein